MSFGLLPAPVLACIACLALGACAAPSGEDSAAGDEAELVGGENNTLYPEAVLLDMVSAKGQKQFCTGVLVAPRVIATAGHCVLGFEEWAVEIPAAAPAARVQFARERALWDWGDPSCGTACLDLALLFLPEPVVVPRYAELAATGVEDGARAVTVGRVRNGMPLPHDTLLSAPFAVRAAGAEYHADGALLEHGDSGGPLFREGTHTLLGVNAWKTSAPPLNGFQRFEAEVPTIRAQIEAHGGF